MIRIFVNPVGSKIYIMPVPNGMYYLFRFSFDYHDYKFKLYLPYDMDDYINTIIKRGFKEIEAEVEI